VIAGIKLIIGSFFAFLHDCNNKVMVINLFYAVCTVIDKQIVCFFFAVQLMFFIESRQRH